MFPQYFLLVQTNWSANRRAPRCGGLGFCDVLGPRRCNQKSERRAAFACGQMSRAAPEASGILHMASGLALFRALPELWLITFYF